MLSDAKYDAKQDGTKGTGLKIFTPKQMLQGLPIALVQVKAGNNSESLLNEIIQTRNRISSITYKNSALYS